MTKRPMLLLIRGLGHSGTTILDLALGAHPEIVGLGEAARILERPKAGEEKRGPAMLRGPYRHERRCTCGHVAAECPIWAPTLNDLILNDDRSLTDKIQSLLQLTVQNRLTEGCHTSVVVDSFQDDLLLPMQLPLEMDVRIIHLVRDVRSWLHSRLKSARQAQMLFADSRTLARWWYVNRKFEYSLKRSGRPVFQLGYEELALQPLASIRLICEWLGLSFSESMLSPGSNSHSHILSGNRVRFDSKRSDTINYDYSWLHSTYAAVHLATLLPFVLAMNKRLVYSNFDKLNSAGVADKY